MLEPRKLEPRATDRGLPEMEPVKMPPKMQWYLKIWKWLNGKKFYIGSGLVAISQSGLIPNPAISNLIAIIGGAIASGGAAHKIVKGIRSGEPTAKAIAKEFNPIKQKGNIMNFVLLLPLIIEVAQKAIDAIIDGSKMNETQIKIVQSAYYLAGIWGPDAVASTATTIDDQLLGAFLSLCEDTADEGEFDLA